MGVGVDFAYNQKKRNIRFSIRRKLLLMSLIAALPFLLLAMYLLTSMLNYSRNYDEIVNNITVANNYNLVFKEEMDESLYKLVVGYVSFDEIAQDPALQDPYALIRDCREASSRLMDMTTEGESMMWLQSMLRNIDTLEKRVDYMRKSALAGGNYNENIQELDNNIYILTDQEHGKGEPTAASADQPVSDSVQCAHGGAGAVGGGCHISDCKRHSASHSGIIRGHGKGG